MDTAVTGDIGYGRCISASKIARWDIDKDVIRGRNFDRSQKFLPDGLSQVSQLDFLSEEEKRYLSQIQGRTYANIFGLVERFITTKILEIAHEHSLGDQTALEAMVRFSDEELKHQELFRRIERLVAEKMPPGYTFAPHPDDVAKAVLATSTWAVLALTLFIELFTQLHARESIAPDKALSPLFKDVFMFHWKEESQHAILDELEWARHDHTLTATERDKSVDEFIALVRAVDAILQAQAAEDSRYFVASCGREISMDNSARLQEAILAAYRWQYIFSGAQHPHFLEVLSRLITEQQGARITAALSALH